MRISRVRIENFRNFNQLDVKVGTHLVIVGENKIGKSNFIYALRLVLDPELPDSARQLMADDFWDGLSRVTTGEPNPIKRGEVIEVSIDLAEFDDNDDVLSVLAEHIVSPDPLVARLTYQYRPRPDLDGAPSKESDYEFILFGGDRDDNRLGYDTRKRIPLNLLQALRDAEGDLESWRRSPLRPLLDKAAGTVPREQLQEVAGKVTSAANAIGQLKQIKALSTSITGRMRDMVGDQALETSFGFSPTDPDRLVRELRLLIDGGQRGVGRASLGSANLLYITLKALEFEDLVSEGRRDHTFLAIEEPEAHLHPHLQRLVYRDFLQPRDHRAHRNNRVRLPQTLLLTTHSPYIASVAPLRSLVLLRKAASGDYTEAVSTASLVLSDKDVADLERYLDVTRGEMLFAKGVLLVEGEAEEYVIPVLGKLLGYDFDELGITVCNIRGTNFLPYVKLLGPDGLNVPFAVLTDLDPQADGTRLGDARTVKILKSLMSSAEFARYSRKQLLALAPSRGVFLNQHTFEIDLFKSGRHKSMCSTLSELTDVSTAKARAAAWKAAPSRLDENQFLRDIEHVSKGRFAQRLAVRIGAFSGKQCPSYIKEAMTFVAARCK